MLVASENCARTPPAERQVEPDPRDSFSRRTTEPAPAAARWYAVARPMTPPPMTTTSARDGSASRLIGGPLGVGCGLWAGTLHFGRATCPPRVLVSRPGRES